MNLDLYIFRMPMALTSLGLLALLLLAAELGFRLGRYFARRGGGGNADAVRGQFTTVEAAEFALVGLLIAFTFSIAASRYENRKLVIVAEANAIGTAYLRAEVLPPEDSRRLRSLMREYVDSWLEMAHSGDDRQRWDAASRKITQLQEPMWAIAAAECRRNPSSDAAGLLLASLNDVFDRHSDSLFAFSNRLPGAIILVLIGAAGVAMGRLGFGYGMAGRRGLITLGTLACLIVVTIAIILDFDRPRRGMFQLSPQNMVDLRQSMAPDESK